LPRPDAPPRDKKVCFWCKYLDHSGPECRRRAPVPAPGDHEVTNIEETIVTARIAASGGRAVWPSVEPGDDWCGEFEEGDASYTTHRNPQDRDEDYV
jgi:hypothetical protein